MKGEGMQVEVTERDIRRGKQESCERCPVARALRRASGKRGWFVLPDYIEGPIRRYPLRGRLKRVARFIERFDSGERGTVKPFTFSLPD